MDDYRNLEWGWSGGLSEAYSLLHNWSYESKINKDLNTINRYQMAKDLFKSSKSRQDSIEILKSFKEINVADGTFVCGEITPAEFTIKFEKGYIQKQIDTLKNKSLALMLKKELSGISSESSNEEAKEELNNIYNKVCDYIEFTDYIQKQIDNLASKNELIAKRIEKEFNDHDFKDSLDASIQTTLLDFYNKVSEYIELIVHITKQIDTLKNKLLAKKFEKNFRDICSNNSADSDIHKTLYELYKKACVYKEICDYMEQHVEKIKLMSQLIADELKEAIENVWFKVSIEKTIKTITDLINEAYSRAELAVLKDDIEKRIDIKASDSASLAENLKEELANTDFSGSAEDSLKEFKEKVDLNISKNTIVFNEIIKKDGLISEDLKKMVADFSEKKYVFGASIKPYTYEPTSYKLPAYKPYSKPYSYEYTNLFNIIIFLCQILGDEIDKAIDLFAKFS